MKTTLAVTGSLLLASVPFTPLAAQESDDAMRGLYIGGAITQSRFDDDTFRVADLDDEDNSWKAIVGARLHEKFAIEGNYIDFGEATSPALPVTGAEAKAYALYAVGMIPVPYVDFFVKAGVARIDAEGALRGVLFEDDAEEFAYGAGLRYRWRNLGIRAEYEKFDTDVVGDLDLISVGLTYTFGRSY